jgi:hypothetical protein
LGKSTQVGEGHTENYLPILGGVLDVGQEVIQELQGFTLGFIHFPVASNNNLAHGALGPMMVYILRCILSKKGTPNQILLPILRGSEGKIIPEIA